MKKINLAIVGATGMVGTSFLKILQKREIKNQIGKLFLFASKKNNGTKIEFCGREIVVETLTEKNIKNKKIDFAFFSAGKTVSKKFAHIFNKYNTIVIDNSSAFRMQKDVPLIVPQVNFEKTDTKIIANPNCSTIQCVLPLKVLQKNYGIKKISFTTFQAVSGSGMNGIKDFHNTMNGQINEFYPHPIFNNVLPHIGTFLPNGFTDEEMKMVNETRKILNISTPISATCVRVPVENCHSVSIEVELEKSFMLKRIRKLFAKFNGIKVIDIPQENLYPLCKFANNTDLVYVGRIRKDLFNKKILHLFCVADNIRKGAATNGIEILEKLIE